MLTKRPREIRRSAGFDKDLAKLERKHRGLSLSVDAYLEQCASEQPERRHLLQGVDGKPVYKERLPLPGTGKRNGARIIVHCDDSAVTALFIYAKSERETLPPELVLQELPDEDDGDTPAD